MNVINVKDKIIVAVDKISFIRFDEDRIFLQFSQGFFFIATQEAKDDNLLLPCLVVDKQELEDIALTIRRKINSLSSPKPQKVSGADQ